LLKQTRKSKAILNFRIKIIDRYIVRKFLGTFFFAIGLIILISIVFDISEKIDDFLEKHAPLRAIIFQYYFNFIPYFVNLFSPLFIFISVIFFTSKMAMQTEIIAILNSGISFRRLLVPYMVAATFLASLSFYLNGWVIPHANIERLAFENTYIKNPYVLKTRNIHRQISPDNFIYFESYNNRENTGYQFSYEKFREGRLVYKLMAERILWDSTTSKWKVENYFIREIDSLHESISGGAELDTNFAFSYEEFNRRINYIEAMDNHELNEFIDQEKMRGAENIAFYEVEKYRRSSYPFATFILTVMGVSLSSRKVRGGIGLQLGAGILLSFTYILFMQVTTTFATNGGMPALLSVWLPNIVFSIIAIYLVTKAPK
jgi:lipopolysaccharide export system permease protein